MLSCHVLLIASIAVHAMAGLTLHVTTYNTGNTWPRDDIKPLLGLKHDPDLISIGFEELGDTEAWESEADEILSQLGYYRVKLNTMSIMQVAVFAKKRHLPYISHIETEYTKTGFGGTYGNKGGTTIRFRLYDKTLAIVNCHLSAHHNQVPLRDEEYWNIISEQDFEDPLTRHLYDHDYLIWSGDLNYRVNLSNEEVRANISSNKHLDLLEYDQLRQEKAAGHAFIGFHEAQITFPPTYKFDPETDIYDTSAKQRIPSWCDRVLWRIREERQEIVSILNWGGGGGGTSDSDYLSSFSVDSNASEGECQVDGVGPSKQKRKKKKKKNVSGGAQMDSDLLGETSFERLRRRTYGLMKKTAVYAATTSNALLRTATGAAPILVHKEDVADPDRFKNLMNTLEREKVNRLKDKYESCVRPVLYESLPDFKQSDHKPVVALLELGVDMTLEPMVQFTAPSFTWSKGEKLAVSYTIGKGVLTSSWDWVALVESTWTDPNKHYITYEWVPPDKNTLKFPWTAHPGCDKKLQVVFCSSKLTAPLAVADVVCTT